MCRPVSIYRMQAGTDGRPEFYDDRPGYVLLDYLAGFIAAMRA